MKVDYSKVFYPFGKDSKKDDISKAEIGNIKLGDLEKLYNDLKHESNKLKEYLANAVVLDKDTHYIVVIDNQIKRVKGCDIVPNVELKLADHLYHYVDGEIKLKEGVLL